MSTDKLVAADPLPAYKWFALYYSMGVEEDAVCEKRTQRTGARWKQMICCGLAFVGTSN